MQVWHSSEAKIMYLIEPDTLSFS